MKCKLGMSSFWTALITMSLVAGQTLWAQATNAATPGTRTGCGYYSAQPVAPQPNPGRAGKEDKSPRLIFVSDHTAGPDSATIVGLWKSEFILYDGTVFDSGYTTWHSDGTELMNSGRAPMTGSFCMGVWEQNSQGTYILNHFALSWDPTGTVFVGPANIRESIVLDPSGNTYTGTFSLTQFDPNGNILAHFAGKVTGSRITPN